jgi:REP element-mobilizing transposase RayT
MARGNGRMLIYLDDRERLYFLDLLGEVVGDYRLACDAYCLMPNHYHLLLETTDRNLSAAIRQLNGVYAQWWNRRHQRVGHVFQGRFKAQLVQGQRCYLHVARYILRNPMRGGLVPHPAAWRWSSVRATTGATSCPAWLRVDKLLATAELRDRTDFAHFVDVEPDREDIAAAVRSDARIIGDKDFVRGFDRQLRSGQSAEVPVRERCVSRPALAELFSATRGSRRVRDEAMWKAHTLHGYSQVEIANFLGLHYTTVSRCLTARRPVRAGAELDRLGLGLIGPDALKR